MPEYSHLPLPKVEINFERRKRGGFGSAPDRDYRRHGQAVSQQVETAIAEHHRKRPPAGIDPSLILRVKMTGSTAEADWEGAGLTVLSVDADKTLVLFSSDIEMEEFRRRLRAYRGGPPAGQKGAPYLGLMASIEAIGTIEPADRIGPLLQADGFVEKTDFDDNSQYVVDMELWDLGSAQLRANKIRQIESFISNNGGEITDRYVGRSLILLRVRASGDVISALLDMSDVLRIDYPPTPDTGISNLLDVGIGDLPQIQAPPADAPYVAVLDTGISEAHPLLATAVGEAIGVPESLRADDIRGHGTKVSGIAIYGDVRACIEAREFVPEVNLLSAKIVNDHGQFDPDLLVANQMRAAISYFSDTYGCKIFNISLGDRRLVYDGGKVGPWSSAVDEMARDLDVVIIISAGNLEYAPPAGEGIDAHIARYPGYLLDSVSKIVEPATAAIAITVGSVSHSIAVPPGDYAGMVGLRPVSGIDEPSPFTRCGPGIGGALKPELCDYGGNLMLDGFARRVTDEYPETSIVTLRNEYIKSLFATAVGTSFAAPKVAFKAAHILSRFPDASANLIRALLASSAEVPAAAEAKMSPYGKDASRRVCGMGIPNLTRATSSDDNRVILYTEGSIELDQFFIYEVPIPDEFITTKGRRHIQVTLAFDPPVRHTRIDYIGTRMSFRLIRGATIDEVAEHYRRRAKEEGPVPDMAKKYNCNLVPGPNSRDIGTLQRAQFSMANNPSPGYGDTYYLVLRCERRWAEDEDSPQRFALVVDVSHEEQIPLYARIEERVRLRVRARAR